MLSAKIDCATSGNNIIIAGVATKKLKIFGFKRIAGGTVNAKFQHGDGVTNTDLEGACPFVANSGDVCPIGPDPWFILPVGKGLHLNLSGAIQVSGHVAYVWF